MKKSTVCCVAVLSAPLLLAGCGGGGKNDSPRNGTLNVSMTDAPSCGYDNVYVTVDQVRVHKSAGADEGDGGWREINLSSPQKVDLLSLSNGVLFTLGQTPLPSGRYEQIRLHLVANAGSTLSNSIVPTGGTEEALSTPSASQSGYKVVGSFDVKPDTLVDVVLDFDACRSIVQKGDGSYALKPVVKAIATLVSGSITGYVDIAQAGASVYAQQAGVVVKGTVADSTGKFVLSPVIQSSTNGNYDVVIAQESFASGVVRSVPVVASTTATTTVSTSASPFILPSAIMNTVSGVVSPASAFAGLEALQLSNGVTFSVGFTNANLDTGAYLLNLSAAAPLVGTFSSLPIALVPDAAVAGQYTIRATSSTGVTQSGAANVAAADASMNFSF